MAKVPNTDRVPLRIIHSEGAVHALYSQEELDAYMQAKNMKAKAMNNLLLATASGDIGLVHNLLELCAQILPPQDFSSITFTALFGIATQGKINKQEMLTTLLSHPSFDHVNHIEGYDINLVFNAISKGDMLALTHL